MAIVSELSAGPTDETIRVKAWEDAYNRFETPQQEVKKFVRRLNLLGVSSWDKRLAVVELFCGRGNGLIALSSLGFRNLEGIDLSASLLAQYSGPASCRVADCRHLPFQDGSIDGIIIQGGLHHLSSIPQDLEQCLHEIHRVLTIDGRVVIVEPWLTPFLSLVHLLCRQAWIRRRVSKIEALAAMIEHERDTYTQWLQAPQAISAALNSYFHPERSHYRWGKLMFVGKRRERAEENWNNQGSRRAR